MTMYKLLSTILIISLFSVFAFSQTQKYSTPTVWENYSVKDKNVTFLMPKLPVVLGGGNSCLGEEITKYVAYSDGVLYILAIISKMNPGAYCEKKKKFDESSFYERVKYLKAVVKQAKIEEAPNEITLLGENNIVKLINDYKNKRWFELQTYEADESKLEVKNFLNSLKIKKKPSGKPIGNGSLSNNGDENNFNDEVPAKSEEKNSQAENTEDVGKNTGLEIILKPKPPYTDAARQANIQGIVRLKVTFLANGGIGSISIVSSLPQGITEQAITAARKIFFIPAKRNGKTYSVAKIIEYSFTLY